MPFRVLTWNIHGFLGQDGRFDPQRVFRIVADLQPDIAAFQEVIGPDAGVDGFGLLREAMPGAESIEANVNRRIQGIYGQVLLSRFQVRSGTKVDLSVAGREPRRAIDAELETPGAPTRVIATHLGLAGAERRYQVGILRGLVEAGPDRDTVLLGDINDWRGGGLAERRLAPLLGRGTRYRTFPAACPVFPLDRIWVRPAGRVVAAGVVRAAGLASDHLPLVVDIEPAPVRAPAGRRTPPRHGPSP
ncbi:MAG: endonuclease/exonuclease/phosphatase family protein [Thalassobaculum sp.]|uniref:endonuclease/exonuclease/phosphatase family protein n=1 Tax=Thalassobaculum sp. TaxID=2022740 RepID=UPI0032EEF151